MSWLYLNHIGKKRGDGNIYKRNHNNMKKKLLSKSKKQLVIYLIVFNKFIY